MPRVKVADTTNPRGAPLTLPPSPCALDDAPVNSVLTVLQYAGEPMEYVLQTPSGQVPLAHNDIARCLPLLAEVRKVGTSTYVANQLLPAVDKPPLVCSSGREAITMFGWHFHDVRKD